MSDWQKWAGGRYRVVDGVRTFYIRQRVGGGSRLEFAVGTDEEEALAEWALFRRDPASYQTPKQRAAAAHAATETGTVRLDTPTVEEFLERCDALVESGDLTREYVDQTLEPYLLQWAKALGGKDLRRVGLEGLRAQLKKWSTAKRKRIVALKAFTAWAREEKDAPKLHRKDDPTVDLITPPVRAAKAVDARGYPMELIERLYAELPSQAARDVICLRAKLGLHDTEIARIASGDGVLRRVSDPSGIEGVIVFQHKKKGKPHAVSCDAQTFAAAVRMQEREVERRRTSKGKKKQAGIARTPMKTMVDRACRRMGMKWKDGDPSPIQPGELRHSFATWATTVGEEVFAVNQRGVDLAKVAEHMGHLSKRTTAVFYVGDRVPMLIRLPLRLVHPEDPVSLPSQLSRRGDGRS